MLKSPMKSLQDLFSLSRNTGAEFTTTGPTLDVDANIAEASAAAQSQRLYDPTPGFDRPILPYEVGQNAPDPQPRSDTDDFFRKMGDLLRSPNYEYYGPYPFGGPTGSYGLQSPFMTPGEWTAEVYTFTAAGSFLLSSTPNQPVPGATTTYNAQNIAGGGGAQMPTVVGIPVVSAAGVTQALSPNWTPCGPQDVLYLTTNLSSGAAYVVVRYRRLLSVSGQPSQTIYG